MSKIKNGGLDQYGAECSSNSNNLEQLALKGLMAPKQLSKNDCLHNANKDEKSNTSL